MTWHALVTNPKCERRAEAGLRELGITVYIPWGRIWSRPKRAPGVVMRLRPAFPRYIFVKVAAPGDIHSVRDVDGVEGVVSAEYIPLAIPDWQIDRVRKAEAEGLLNFNREPKTWKGGEYEIGQSLTITGGPFAGFTGRVVRRSTKKGVDLETLLFGRATVTTVKLDDVKIAA